LANPNTVNIGATPNDGTGDPIRDAFSKVNSNFDKLFTTFVADNSITVGNATVNSVISNTGGLVVSNSTASAVANVSTFKIGNTTANSTLTGAELAVFGTAAIGSATVNTTALMIGNATVNASMSLTTLALATASVNSSISVNSTAINLGNSTVNATANSTRITIASANLTTNTLLLGTGTTGSSVGSTNYANGFTRLPNGLLYQFGYIAGVNSIAGGNTTTFASVGCVAFQNLFSVSVVSNSVSGVFVLESNSTAIVLSSSNTGNPGVAAYWTAIGK
jgi:hypothetical protein